MKTTDTPRIATLFASALFAGNAIAGTQATPAPKPADPQPLLSFFDGKVVFDVEERLRWETRDNTFDFNSGKNAITDGNFLLQRFRMGLTLKPAEWLKIYAQVQDSREFFSVRPAIPGASSAEGNDSFDLRQFYIELSDPSKCPWGLKLGRQELSFGDERLVGAFDWNNFGRSFDAAKLTYKKPGFTLDAFTATPVVITNNNYDQSDFFNGTETNRGLVFSGVYASFNDLPFGVVDAYTFMVDEPRGNTSNAQGTLAAPVTTGSLKAHSDFATIGTRIKGDPKKLNGFEFGGEFAYQVGDLRGLSLNAFAATVGAGYNFDAPWKPRVYAEYNYASGDGNSADRNIGTFQNLFPTNHPFYGIMDVFSWQNLQNAMLSFKVTPVKDVTMQLDYNAFWLADTNDTWYRANGLNVVRPLNATSKKASDYCGSEVDFIVKWKVNRFLAVQAGYSHFVSGDYLKSTGFSSDANFGYVQATIKF
ncbi:MAG: alginate export family protein [Chthoniobacteraceae bacterium]